VLIAHLNSLSSFGNETTGQVGWQAGSQAGMSYPPCVHPFHEQNASNVLSHTNVDWCM